jgi:hypothetical protein
VKYLSFSARPRERIATFATALLPNVISALLYRCPKHPVNRCCRLTLDVWHQVAINVHCDRN